ncbi:MAG: Asp-tRNA(Asn)/Glu-tRNA(Gln) amidotransferase subunit GatC [Candidatus Bathyarchaeia archaeon]
MAERKNAISREEVEHLAWLARLELTDDEKDLFTRQLNDIIDYFSSLEELDTEDAPSQLHVLELTDVFREDEPKPCLPREKILKMAPKIQEAYIKAPKMV